MDEWLGDWEAAWECQCGYVALVWWKRKEICRQCGKSTDEWAPVAARTRKHRETEKQLWGLMTTSMIVDDGWETKPRAQKTRGCNYCNADPCGCGAKS